MRHQKSGRQFGRNTSHRRAMFRALTANLVLHERIETTEAKAKELRRFADRIITRARRLGAIAYTPNDKLKPAERAQRLAATRQVGRFLQRFGVKTVEGDSQKVDLIEKVFVDLAQRYRERPGGYTRIVKLGSRRGDNAPMTRIELVDGQAPVAGGDKPKAKAAKKEAKAAPAAAGAKASKAKAADAAEGDKPKRTRKKAAAEKSE
jgi:large subunit ribosomal protein L17